MIRKALRAAGAMAMRTGGMSAYNRRVFYGGRRGLRMVNVHETHGAVQMRWFRDLVAFCLDHFDVGTPDDVGALDEGRFVAGERDRVLFTFDDGNSDNFEAASHLAAQGLRGCSS